MRKLFDRKYFLVGIAINILVGLQSCFTGIESTPKITAKHVSREGAQSVLVPEEEFLQNVQGDSLGIWKPGKRFFVTDNRIAIALEPSKSVLPKQGDIIEFSHFNEVPSMTGKTETEIVFSQNDTAICVYRINSPLEELRKRPGGVEVPFTIEMSIVDKARKQLQDSVFFVRSAVWYSPDGDHTIRGKKFIPVKVTSVEPGNLFYPLRVCFRPVDGDENESGSVYMSVSDNSKSGRNFAMLFSLTNPRLRYPEVSDEVWKNIQDSRVAKYMTREECRLALGAPKTVQRRNVITSLQEMWTYENGVYLLFDDGILQSFRQ